MKKSLFAAAVLCTVAGLTTAQSAVIPNGFATKEGDTYYYRLGNYNYCRQQIIYGSKLLSNLTAPYTIKSLKLRRDGTRTTAYVAHKCYGELYMSNNTREPLKQYCQLWDHNKGKDYMQVMTKTVISWPADAIPTTPPAPFTVGMVLTKPFVYTGKALLFDFMTDKFAATDPDYQYWYPDGISTFVSGAAPTGGARASIGTGCPTDFYHYATYPYIGNRNRSYGYTRVASTATPCLLLQGVSDKAWGAIKLPFDLTGLGAPGCHLYVDYVLGYTGTADPANVDGKVEFEKGVVPFVQAFVGMSFFEQIVAIDAKYNAMGLRFSRASKLTIGSGFLQDNDGISFFGYRASWLPFDYKYPYAPNRGFFVPVMQLN